MANLYVASTGSNTAPYDTWAKAATAPATAVNAAAVGDTVYIHGETFTLGADATWTLGGSPGTPIRVICSNDKVNEPPQTLSTAGSYLNASTAWDWTINGHGYIYGFGLTSSGTAALTANLIISNTDNDDITFESAPLSLASTSTTGNIQTGPGASANCHVRFVNCTITFSGVASSGFKINCNFEMIGGSVSGSGAFTSLIVCDRSGSPDFIGVDFTGISSSSATIYAPNSQMIDPDVRFINCRLPSGPTIVGSFTGVDQGEILILDSANGDQHYQFQHYNFLGSTIPDTAIYNNTGATYDGTNYYSWKIVTTANATLHTPYISPWIQKYHSGTSAITPYIEILRDGSSTAYKDNEVWATFGCKTTTGNPIMTFSNDRVGLLSTAANQTAGVGLSGWTGENATAWSGKCEALASMTPAEIGVLVARINVGVASSTVYIDPYIRT